MTEEPVPTLLYRLTEAYNMDDATPESYMKLAERWGVRFYVNMYQDTVEITWDPRKRLGRLFHLVGMWYDFMIAPDYVVITR